MYKTTKETRDHRVRRKDYSLTTFFDWVEFFRAPGDMNNGRYLRNRPQVSMVYKLINHAKCWQNTRRICKPRAAGDWFTNSSSVLLTSQVVYQLLVNSLLRLLHFQLFDWLKNSDYEPIVGVLRNMENSAPSLKIFRFVKIGGKTRFENLLKQLFHSPLLDMK